MTPPQRLGLRLPPRRAVRPALAIAVRLGVALALVLVNWGIVLLERGDYRDSLDGSVSVVDALYYTTVTLSTTGYGDITPVSQTARLVNALVVAPMRVAFVVVLVGTTLSALTERSRADVRLARWRSRVHDHVVVLGYGTKGRGAVRALRLRDHPAERVVVLDADPAATARASADGLAVVTGSAVDPVALAQAEVGRARTVLVALDRDDTAVLAVLTLARVAPQATVVASAREAATAALLRQSGAEQVVVSSETTGRLLGLAADSPQAVGVVEDLLSFGRGLDLDEREVRADEVGRPPSSCEAPVLAVLRDGEVLAWSDARAQALRPGDRLLHVTGPPPRAGGTNGA